MRHSDEMAIYQWELSHRPDRDGSIPSGDKHITFVEAVEAADDAWNAVFARVTRDQPDRIDVAAVNVNGDFRREMFVGAAQLDVRLTRLGRSSITWTVEIVQEGQSAATITIVLSRVAADRGGSQPLSESDRAVLEPLLEPVSG